MTTAQPPFNGARPPAGHEPEGAEAEVPPAEGAVPEAVESGDGGATKTPAAKVPARRAPARTGAKAGATSAGSGATKTAGTAKTSTAKPAAAGKTTETAKTTATRTRRAAAKPPEISPEGEAPEILDAVLGTPSAEEAPKVPRKRPARTTKAAPASPEGGAVAPDVSIASPDTAADASGTVGANGAVPEPVAATGTGETSTVAAPPAAGTEQPTAAPGATPPPPGAIPPGTVPPGTVPPGTDAPAHAYPRTVSDLADRLDDARFFSSLFDFTFTKYVTRKLAGPVYVVGLVLIALGIVVGFANSLAAAVATHSPVGAFLFLFGFVITLVAAMLAILLLRVGIEVFVAIIEIAQNTRGRRRPPRE